MKLNNKIKILLILILCWTINLSAQEKDISGSYYDDVGYEIKIIDNHFYYIEKQNQHMPIWSTDTLARCIFEREGKNFIKVNSTTNLFGTLAGMEISQSRNDALHDSIKVVFHIPNYCHPLIINFCDNNFKRSEFRYSKNDTTYRFPDKTQSFSFTISPEATPIHKVDGRFFGISILYSARDIKIENNMNVIDIYIPMLNNSTFEEYCLIDEYVKVEKGCIYWKGNVFKKR